MDDGGPCFLECGRSERATACGKIPFLVSVPREGAFWTEVSDLIVSRARDVPCPGAMDR